MSELTVVIISIILSFWAIFFYVRLHYRRKQTQTVIDTPAVPSSIEQATDETHLQVERLRQGFKRMAQADDPLQEFIDAISRGDNGNHKNFR